MLNFISVIDDWCLFGVWDLGIGILLNRLRTIAGGRNGR
jgi:hypothetical protein